MDELQMTSAQGSRAYYLELVVGATLISIVYLFYLSFWWDSYCMPVLEWFPFYAQQMRMGKFVYKDFYFFLPPLHLIELEWIQRIFGEELWVPRIAGILQRLGIALTVMAWLSRSYSVWDVVPAVIAGVMVSETGLTFGLFNYWDASILYGVLMGFFAWLSLERLPGGGLGLAFVAGFFGGLASVTKQTMGPMTTAAACLAMAFILWRRAGWRQAAVWVGVFSLGWWLPFGVTLGWLARHGALRNYVDQVYLHGPSSKGSVRSILARPLGLLVFWVQSLVGPGMFVSSKRRAALGLIFVLAAAVEWHLGFFPASKTRPSRRSALVTSALALLAVFVAHRVVSTSYVAHPNAFMLDYCFSPRGLPSAALYVTSWLAFLSVIHCALNIPLACYRFWREPSRTDRSFRLLYSAVAVGLYYSTSVSMGAQTYEPIGWVAVSLMLVDLARVHLPIGSRAPRVLLSMLAVIACFGVTCVRLSSPNMWIGWTERPVDEHVYRSRNPLLKHLRFSQDAVRCLDGVAAIVEQHSKPGDSILADPLLPLFYFLTNRHPLTFNYVHYLDVCPDTIARGDADRLLANPPAVLIEMVLPAETEDDHERIFRGTGTSGQRDLKAVIRKLTAGYKLEATFDGPSFTHAGIPFPIKVWVRPDPVRTKSAPGGASP